MGYLRKHSSFALFIWIIVSALVAYVVSALLIGEEFRGYVIGNPVFAITLAGLIYITRTPSTLGVPQLSIMVLSLVLFGAMGAAGLVLINISLRLARLIAGPIAVIGYYPVGADVWYPLGITIWLISTFALTFFAVLVGVIAGKRFVREHRET